MYHHDNMTNMPDIQMFSWCVSDKDNFGSLWHLDTLHQVSSGQAAKIVS